MLETGLQVCQKLSEQEWDELFPYSLGVGQPQGVRGDIM